MAELGEQERVTVQGELEQLVQASELSQEDKDFHLEETIKMRMARPPHAPSHYGLDHKEQDRRDKEEANTTQAPPAGQRSPRQEMADPALQQPPYPAVKKLLRQALAGVDKVAKEAHDLNHALAQEVLDMRSADAEEDLRPSAGQEAQEDGEVQVQHQEVHQAEEGSTRPAWLAAFSADLQAHQGTAQQVSPREVPAKVITKGTEAPALDAKEAREEVPNPTAELGAWSRPRMQALDSTKEHHRLPPGRQQWRGGSFGHNSCPRRNSAPARRHQKGAGRDSPNRPQYVQ